MQQKGAASIVIGEIPAVETFDISEKMRGQTAGKAVWNSHFKAWTPVPKSIITRN
jgi:elongation factor 2